ncbi:2-(1,2-epoxy-1,2-dihydrophenyl)acetyl-CoA isomerase [Mangrovimicrobium sediminis]|uniref:2-(1,2-epoxy-1,2-dihydrophenyl)acetyl-CoA isomerase n=1 Tax=Mangrovimicrobium sediminis TaxID=2562682 RepID=A0A4Z0LVB1_9GAMM|nr:enoyl-CoA hydratase-related protein [Haliea sp. SAOS-164]TGD70995.1 2-(1,2-epoxy-1,2-dihydrophenyl)acetyl-CoA isomerase [Haliea sp. SAOS-164]
MSRVLTEVSDAVCRITLNDPRALNALCADMSAELLEAVTAVADPACGVRCLLLTGAGRAFCAGGSLDLIAGAGDGSGLSLGTHHHRVIRMLAELHCPVLTAVNGPAAGLGFSYALAGDMVVAARSAYFLGAFSNVGVSPDGGLSWLLPRLIGTARAREVLLLGQRLGAEQALDWGLVNRVYDDATFADEALALAQQLAAGPTRALGEMRRLLQRAWQQDLAAQLDEEERVQAELFGSADAREGARALVEKRSPRFRGH